jgi:hypothetical protein
MFETAKEQTLDLLTKNVRSEGKQGKHHFGLVQ